MSRIFKRSFVILISAVLFLVFYSLKSGEGINLFDDLHLSDFVTGRVIWDPAARGSLKRDLFPPCRDDKPAGCNLLPTLWRVYPVKGVAVQIQDNVLEVDFQDPAQFHSLHISPRCKIKPDTIYKVNAYIRTEGLEDPAWISLAIVDSRGDSESPSARAFRQIRAATEWQPVEVQYRTLPDAQAVRVVIRRYWDKPPLKGRAYIRDVKLERVVPPGNGQMP
jgi:hypothetical protein